MCEKVTTDNKYRYYPSVYENEDNIYLLLVQKVDSLAKSIVKFSFGLAIAEASENVKEYLEFDMLDDVMDLNKIIVDFEDDVEITDGIMDISELRKKELKEKIGEFKRILDLLKL